MEDIAPCGSHGRRHSQATDTSFGLAFERQLKSMQISLKRYDARGVRPFGPAVQMICPPLESLHHSSRAIKEHRTIGANEGCFSKMRGAGGAGLLVVTINTVILIYLSI
jgi:hypothetical protein